MKFSLIHPSRSRERKSYNTICRWADRMYGHFNDDVQLIVSVDIDDPQLSDYKDSYADEIFINANKSAVEAINNAAKFSNGDIIIVVSDDTDCPLYWDKILIDAIGKSKDFVMKVDDGIQKRIITMPIMDRAYYNRDGYIYNPIYSHSWSDTELTECAHLRGRVITRMDIKFPHQHYSVTGEQPDELYKRNDRTHDRDRHLYQNRKRINFGL